MGLPAGVRFFGKAFARALPSASFADSRWSELPLGFLGRALVDVRVDAEGHLETLELAADQDVPAPIRAMVDNTRLLLKSGTFSLHTDRESPGSERWSLEVTIGTAAPNPDDTADPRRLFGMGHREPLGGKPGFAQFTLNSGRHVAAALQRLPTP